MKAKLSDNGFGTPKEFNEMGPPDPACVEQCEKWIKRYCQKTKNIRSNAFSYFLKHVVEGKDGYVSNGSFIQAAINLGYCFRRCSLTSPNACFNMEVKARFKR